ncbi:MAG TPA: FAD-dependent oxidoreductase [Bryobacteraceae bacterium]|nr:FAD-dependent oxidoreductase [Bryobacteraceae bacterium]
MTNTRRDFLTKVGLAGGYSATFTAMQALGLLPSVGSAASVVDLPFTAGKGVKVAILGGGIAGLVSAYELGKAGFHCTVLEARDRPGGRNWTVRNGTTVEFLDGTKQTAQYVSPDSYFNAGPARIPSIHKTILGYCKELGVALEVFVNTNRSSLMLSDQAFGGKPVEQRQVINDTRGHIAELLAKCVNQGALDQELNKEDRERLLSLLRSFGDLKIDYQYQGSDRAGVTRLPGAGDVTEILRAPLDLHSLMKSNLWINTPHEETLDMQATMFQPVGGIDHIPYAFAKKLGKTIEYQAVVKEIRKSDQGVKIVYTHHGAEKSISADYCICALPIVILKSIANDFSAPVKQAISATHYSAAYKIAWESKRFWEAEDNIYGGISWMQGGPINMVWYPSGKMHTDVGVVLSGYGLQSLPAFDQLPNMEARFAASRAAVETLHPGHGKDLSSPMYVAWDKIPYNQGSWISSFGDYYTGPYRAFLEPDGHIYFAGDHCSHVVAWQEGAALSAHRTVQMIGERVRSAKA